MRTTPASLAMPRGEKGKRAGAGEEPFPGRFSSPGSPRTGPFGWRSWLAGRVDSLSQDCALLRSLQAPNSSAQLPNSVAFIKSALSPQSIRPLALVRQQQGRASGFRRGDGEAITQLGKGGVWSRKGGGGPPSPACRPLIDQMLRNHCPAHRLRNLLAV